MSVEDVALVSVATTDWQRLVLRQAFIACKNGLTPKMAITRFMLYARTCRLISVLTRFSVLVRK
jgi:hypothetical protein